MRAPGPGSMPTPCGRRAAMPRSLPAFRRPLGPIFLNFFTRLSPDAHPNRHIPGEMSAYFLRPDGDLSGRRRGDKARCGRSDLVRGRGIRSMSSQSVRVRDLAGGVRVLTRLAALVLVAAALGACSLFDKDTVIPDEPADKLY